MATLFQPHDRIAGRFQIISYVGSGGIGEVYRASDETGFIAIKALLPRVVPAYITTDRIRDALLGHLPEEDPMVLPREVVEHGEVRCIVSRFVAGEDARELLRRRDRSADPRPALMFFDLFLERLSSLPPFAVHGALKPENIIVAQAGDRLFHRDVEIQITDINFPRVLSFSKYASIQLARGPAFDYLAPEFVTMGGRVDQRADIYSAGMLLYELLTGTTAKKEFAPPSKAGSAAPRELDDVLRRALAASPDERFSSLREFQDALRKAAPVIGERLASQPIEMSQIDMFTGREEVTHRVDVSTIEEFDPFSEAPAEPRAAAAAHRGPGEFEDIDRAFDQAMETGEAQEFTAPEDVTHEDMEPVFDDVDVFAEPAEKPRETIHAEPPFVLPAAPLAPRPEAATDMASRVVFAFLGIAAVIVGFFIYRSVTAPDDAVTPV
ncbi:protein kinase, partial [bacterium]|nr:protein kinase [bacterium]